MKLLANGFLSVKVFYNLIYKKMNKAKLKIILTNAHFVIKLNEVFFNLILFNSKL